MECIEVVILVVKQKTVWNNHDPWMWDILPTEQSGKKGRDTEAYCVTVGQCTWGLGRLWLRGRVVVLQPEGPEERLCALIVGGMCTSGHAPTPTLSSPTSPPSEINKLHSREVRLRLRQKQMKFQAMDCSLSWGVLLCLCPGGSALQLQSPAIDQYGATLNS
ncbi:unnamed protein product [Pleuronectes platessa]|uniref:Uncharacterized protein n=1 Tax=Pleuronectes platessa TaxID=8262 RepID=A0A9N7TRV7_PLEPL|nr:unnamed protein product [Pleuronectes platessa]